MFDKAITNNDIFLEMPDSTQNLYFHLSMEADDDGFVDNWKSVMRMTGKKEDDLKLLVVKKFIIPFDSGVIVIRHWRINNYLRRDRYRETKYLFEKEQLKIEKNEEYSLRSTTGIPGGIPSGNPVKYSIEENSIEENSSTNNYLTIDRCIEEPLNEEIASDDFEAKEESVVYEMDTKKLQNVCEILEKEFGRMVTPLETEKIKTWDYPIEVIRLAIAESVSNGIFYIKYIDRIIFNWKKANVRTVEEAKNQIEKFRQGKDEKKDESKKELSKWDKVRLKLQEGSNNE